MLRGKSYYRSGKHLDVTDKQQDAPGKQPKLGCKIQAEREDKAVGRASDEGFCNGLYLGALGRH